MLKVAFVVQRNGLEVNGGSEEHCYMLSQAMKEVWDVEILTTCALEYSTWENHYSPGVEVVNDVPIRRFAVDFPRHKRFAEYSEYVFSNINTIGCEESEKWMYFQGPISTSMSKYIESHADDYDMFVFFTYLYATTYYNLPQVAHKSLLVPTAHDEPPIYLPIFDSMFSLPCAMAFNTKEEKKFLQRRFPQLHLPGDIVGVGIHVPRNADGYRFLRRNSFDFPYVMYLGRIDEHKGCAQLFDFFCRYKSERFDDLKLVLAGKSLLEIPKSLDIVYLGYVSDQDKYDMLQGCQFLINPSFFESLSMVLLEAWGLGKPTLVTEKSEVMVGQSRRSNAGLWYADYYEFVQCADFLRAHPELGANGISFVAENYSWARIQEKFENLANTYVLAKAE